MSKSTSHLLLAVLLLPLTLVVRQAFWELTVKHVVQGSSTDAGGPLVWLGPQLVTCVFVMGYWLLLWRKQVHWNRRRVWATVLCCAAAATAIGVALLPQAEPQQHTNLALYGLSAGGWMFYSSRFNVTDLVLLVWIASTLLIWRETRAARTGSAGAKIAHIACPGCGAGMEEQRECRCGACGTQFTLGELMAAQSRFKGPDLREA